MNSKMNTKRMGAYLLFASIIFFQKTNAQERKYLPLDSLFALTERNSVQLSLAKRTIGIDQLNTDIAKEKQLPSLGANVDLGYLTNAAVWDNHVKYERSVIMPHVINNYSVSAGMEIFHGKAIKNSIAKADLEEQVSSLDYEKDRQDIEFLLLSKYLDLATWYNQRKVYVENIALADKRLDDVEKLRKEGMVTKNDIVRNELQRSEMHLQLQEVDNNINIISHEICTVIGLDEKIIVVDSAVYIQKNNAKTFELISDINKSQLPELQSASKKMAIAEKDIAITKAEKSPVISLFASDQVNRPFLYTLQPLDIYMHYAEGGIKLQYNISSLYNAKKHIDKAKIGYEIAKDKELLLEQKTDMEIHAAKVKLKEAKERYQTEQESVMLAQDNYRIVNQKYLNQLAVMTDVMDASTALLQAQLNLANAQVGIAYQWFHLNKVTGNWSAQQVY